jgi:beta-xylosidase
VSHSPAWAGDFPDPFVLRVDQEYWAFGTNAEGRNVQVLHSADLGTWEPAGDALPHLPGWAAAGRTWAPSVLDLAALGDGHTPDPDHRFVLYVTVREPKSNRQAIMVATAASPAGPYQPSGSGPLVFQLEAGGSIDPSPFVDNDGTAYLSWKADANALHQPASLWAQLLSADGTALAGSPAELLRVDQRWEEPLVEAPSLVRDGDRYYLFYSGGWWGSDGYAVGYAVGDHPLGPWRKATTDRPWFGSDPEVSGPGGQEFFADPTGQRWMAYHGWEPGRVTYKAGGKRTMRLAQISFAGGRPQANAVAGPDGHRHWWQRDQGH